MRTPFRLFPYAVAVLSVAAAVPLTLALRPLEQTPAPTAFFFAAVMLSAFFGGLGPGLLATLLSALALEVVFLPSAGPGPAAAAAVRLAVFVLVAALISWLNARRRRLEAELRRRDRRKDEFVAALAHELRNFLSPVSNVLHVLRAGGTDGGLAAPREIIERQVRHMSRLINDLLDVARVNEGKVRLCKEPVDLAAAVTGSVEAARPLLAARGHRLEVALPPDRVVLDADPTRLEQVLVNLLANAAKYTEPGGHIWLVARREGDEVRVSVRDSGVGLAPEVLPHVFELFVQAENGCRGGLGIGLNLVQSLVRMHGGSVSVTSEGPGKGSEFEIRLPLSGAGTPAAVSASSGTGHTPATP
jgi:signal transduction histidine kinase